MKTIIPAIKSQIVLSVGEPVKNLDKSETNDSEAVIPQSI